MKKIKTKKITIYLDESGTLPDPKDKVVIIAAVGTNAPKELTDVTKSVRKYLRTRKSKPNEIKFYQAGEKTKVKFLTELSKKRVEIFVLVVEKMGRKIADSPENVALLSWILLEDCITFYGNSIKKLVFDRHFHRQTDENSFNKILSDLLGIDLIIEHVDSQKDKKVNSADMIAGSLLWEKTGKSDKFYKIIKGKIISEKVIGWKNAKRLLNEKSR